MSAKNKEFVLELSKRPEYTVQHPTLGFSVTIQPMVKSDEQAIEKKIRGNERVKISTSKKNGFRQKKGDVQTETMEIPEGNVPLKNKLVAQKSWVAWNIAKFECNEVNIGLLFDNFYDTHAVPILEAFEDVIEAFKGEEEAAAKN